MWRSTHDDGAAVLAVLRAVTPFTLTPSAMARPAFRQLETSAFACCEARVPNRLSGGTRVRCAD
jgi:hypothetical protein